VKQTVQNDTVVWEAFRSGDAQAFAGIYETHYNSLYSYGRKYTTCDALIEDAIQELFITLWRTCSQLSPVTHIKFYLFCCLRRDIHKVTDQEKRLVSIDPSRHSIQATAFENTQVIAPTDPRVVYFIPQQELILNANLIQNP
jgi:RNA polymerase sigma factor (sigma-70 family)